MSLIHARKRPCCIDGKTMAVWRYRLWSDVVESGSYLTEDMTEDELRSELRMDFTLREIIDGVAEKKMSERIEYTQRYGTSSRIDRPSEKFDPCEPWEEPLE